MLGQHLHRNVSAAFRLRAQAVEAWLLCHLLRCLLTGASMVANGSSQTSHPGVPRHKQQGLEAIMGEQERPPPHTFSIQLRNL